MALEKHDTCFLDGLRKEEPDQDLIDEPEIALWKYSQIEDGERRLRGWHSPAVCNRTGDLQLTIVTLEKP